MTCPDGQRGKKGKIIDCSAVLPSGRPAQVFVTLIDNEGHYTYQPEQAAVTEEFKAKFAEDAKETQARIERDTAAAVAALPRETFVDSCQDQSGADYCGCAWDALDQPARDEALVGVLSRQPSETLTDAIRACGGTTD